MTVCPSFFEKNTSRNEQISRSGWDQHKRKLNAQRWQNFFAPSSEKQWQEGLEELDGVMGAVEDYMENASKQQWIPRPWSA